MSSEADIVSWANLLEDKPIEEDLEPMLEGLGATESGRVIHSYLEEEFSDIGRWENEVFYQEDDGNWKKGKYDCFDGDFVYEFKTKYGRAFEQDYRLPCGKDVNQLKNYLEATDSDWGVLVYISRDSFQVEEYLVGQDD